MEFLDLNDEITADDWLIPSEEISERRLIKQTPRYNIYKADWFGDVLYYEPRKDKSPAPLELKHKYHPQRIDFEDQEELRTRLGQLCLSKSRFISRSQLSLSNDGGYEQTDSAYSSISSTPQYYTKNFESEFEFPNRTSTSTSQSSSLSSISNLSDGYNDNNFQVSDELLNIKIQNTSEKQVKQIHDSSPVILNKDSYTFDCCQFKLQSPRNAEENEDNASNTSKQISWFELNELRLIAHESFILFMGASMDDASESTSLVMQMSHPKAMSLYNLLHATKSTNAASCYSPIDRFFSCKQQRPQLSIDAKLNICQQVTNAMTYLHDKNIVHGKLTSVNIYLEPNQRVKISLIDNSEAAIATTRGQNKDSVQFNLPSLTYLSPELIKTMRVVEGSESNQQKQSHVQVDANQLTKKSDVFSFGTLLFELFEERFPFGEVQDTSGSTLPSPRGHFNVSPTNSPSNSKLLADWNGNIKSSANEIIFQIGSGQIEAKNLNLTKNRCPSLVGFIISQCWSNDLNIRPRFKQLSFA